MTLVVGMLVTTLAGAQESAPKVTISAVDDAELTPMVPVAGTVHSRHATTITAGLAARLAWIAEPGDFVASGDPVATFDCEMIKLRREEQVEQTRLEEIRLASLTREVQRLEQAELAVPATQLAQLRADREMSASQLRIAGVRVRQTENELRRCTAVAPFDGVVTRRFRNDNEDVPRGELLLDFTDTQGLEVRAQVPVRYLPRVRTGSMAAVRLNTLHFDSLVRATVPAAEAASQAFEVRIDLPPAAREHLAAGQLVSVSLPLAGNPALTVPRDAIVLRAEGAYVMRIANDNRAQRIAVEVSEANGDRVAVKGDLQAGDTVAVRGAEALDDGQLVIVYSDS
ncbi:MAG: efflux RND transporter periplasmic adaptor subunit [Pseudomonadota bacterium]